MKTDMKAKLRRHEMCIGTHVSLNEAVVTEMMGYLPYDYLWIDMEHSVINTERLLGQLIAARASGINAIVRIPANDPILAKPVLDAGADGIIFPMIRGYDDAARAMEACMYPPRGVRGYGPWRAYRFGTINGADYRATVDDTLLRFIQIEEMGAIRELDKILTIDAIDAFIFGPNDLSGSMGKLGQTNDPEVRAVIDEAIAKINAEMWAELFLWNRENLSAQIDQFSAALQQMKGYLEAEDKIAYLSGSFGEGGGTTFVEINKVRKIFDNSYSFNLPSNGIHPAVSFSTDGLSGGTGYSLRHCIPVLLPTELRCAWQAVFRRRFSECGGWL